MRLSVYFLFTFIFILEYLALGELKNAILTKSCMYYNETICDNHQDARCNAEIECNHSMKNVCYVLWSNSTNGTLSVQHKGCFIGTSECTGQSQCVEKTVRENGFYFCCCEGDNCNQHFFWDPIPLPVTTTTEFSVRPKIVERYDLPVLLAVVPLSIFMVLIFMLLHQKRKLPFLNEFLSFNRNQQCPSSPAIEKLMPIHLIEVKAKGKFGAIWKAIYNSEIVAVKIMQAQAKQSWITEQDVYKLPLMNHDNVLHFLGAEKHGDNLHTEFWLITAYHEIGSLHDFLKSNIISWEQLCHIAYTLARGLNYLHEEIPSEKPEYYKPAIAHRDLKSSNVLLKTDLSACIADFGLALAFKPLNFCCDTHGQVGTYRYMAPEVLEGAINFSRDSYLRIDMYACGLVLWELANRCTTDGVIAADYKLPFEDEIGQHPSLEEIQDIVVHKKQRPAIKDSWKRHAGLSLLGETIEECWDQDAEARISSCCIMERISWFNHLTCSNDTSALLIGTECNGTISNRITVAGQN